MPAKSQAQTWFDLQHLENVFSVKAAPAATHQQRNIMERRSQGGRKWRDDTVGEGQAVTVPDGDVHHTGGGQLLDQFGSECRGLRGATAQARAASPCIHLKQYIDLH